MNLVADSPVSSSSSDDFAAFLDAELDSSSDGDKSDSGVDGDSKDENERVKRRKVELKNIGEPHGSQKPLATFLDSELDSTLSDPFSDTEMDDDYESETERITPPKMELANTEEPHGSQKSLEANNICTHPAAIYSMCVRCGEKVDEGSGVAFGYIHKDLRLGNDEIARLRTGDLKNLLQHKKLYLVLDLDHTLLNSTRLVDLTPEEEYLKTPAEAFQGSLYDLDFMQMMTKLRPFVRSFLKEASNLFEMYIYTMGERSYALQMAKLLDPEELYFASKIISQADCTQKHQKGLDVMLGQENAVLILDDTELVWQKHKENLILMDRYHFFASSCRQFGFNCQSLSLLKNDENEDNGALATVLKVLKRVHTLFYDSEAEDTLGSRDVRQILSKIRAEVLMGCRILFSRAFNAKDRAQLWATGKQLGATCTMEMEGSVTHVVSVDMATNASKWGVREKKFVVSPRWMDASKFLWSRQAEHHFRV